MYGSWSLLPNLICSSFGTGESCKIRPCFSLAFLQRSLRAGADCWRGRLAESLNVRPSPATQQPSNPATQQPSNPANQQPSKPTTQQTNKPATRQPSNPVCRFTCVITCVAL